MVPSVWGTAQSHQQHYQLLPPNAHTLPASPSVANTAVPNGLRPPTQAPCSLPHKPPQHPICSTLFHADLSIFLPQFAELTTPTQICSYLNWDPKEELEVNSSFQAAFLTKLQALSLSCLMGYFPPCIYKHVVIHIDLGLSIKNIFYIKTGCQPKWTMHLIRCYCQS